MAGACKTTQSSLPRFNFPCVSRFWPLTSVRFLTSRPDVHLFGAEETRFPRRHSPSSSLGTITPAKGSQLRAILLDSHIPAHFLAAILSSTENPPRLAIWRKQTHLI